MIPQILFERIEISSQPDLEKKDNPYIKDVYSDIRESVYTRFDITMIIDSVNQAKSQLFEISNGELINKYLKFHLICVENEQIMSLFVEVLRNSTPRDIIKYCNNLDIKNKKIEVYDSSNLTTGFQIKDSLTLTSSLDHTSFIFLTYLDIEQLEIDENISISKAIKLKNKNFYIENVFKNKLINEYTHLFKDLNGQFYYGLVEFRDGVYYKYETDEPLTEESVPNNVIIDTRSVFDYSSIENEFLEIKNGIINQLRSFGTYIQDFYDSSKKVVSNVEIFQDPSKKPRMFLSLDIKSLHENTKNDYVDLNEINIEKYSKIINFALYRNQRKVNKIKNSLNVTYSSYQNVGADEFVFSSGDSSPGVFINIPEKIREVKFKNSSGKRYFVISDNSFGFLGGDIGYKIDLTLENGVTYWAKSLIPYTQRIQRKLDDFIFDFENINDTGIGRLSREQVLQIYSLYQDGTYPWNDLVVELVDIIVKFYLIKDQAFLSNLSSLIHPETATALSLQMFKDILDQTIADVENVALRTFTADIEYEFEMPDTITLDYEDAGLSYLNWLEDDKNFPEISIDQFKTRIEEEFRKFYPDDVVFNESNFYLSPLYIYDGDNKTVIASNDALEEPFLRVRGIKGVTDSITSVKDYDAGTKNKDNKIIKAQLPDDIDRQSVLEDVGEFEEFYENFSKFSRLSKDKRTENTIVPKVSKILAMDAAKIKTGKNISMKEDRINKLGLINKQALPLQVRSLVETNSIPTEYTDEGYFKGINEENYINFKLKYETLTKVRYFNNVSNEWEDLTSELLDSYEGEYIICKLDNYNSSELHDDGYNKDLSMNQIINKVFLIKTNKKARTLEEKKELKQTLDRLDKFKQGYSPKDTNSFVVSRRSK